MDRTIRNCNVCVVGGAGFLGSHLVNHLIEDRQCSVLVIDNLVVGRCAYIHPRATFEHYDITGSEGHLLKLFNHYEIQYVFNYAAEPYIPVSFERPLHVCNTNFFGAMKVINAAQDAGCIGVLQVSSAEIYGECPVGERIDENAPVKPHSSYGASKLAIDAWVQARWKEAKTPCIAMRQFNCLGERETHPYVVPEIIQQVVHNPLEDGKKTITLGNNTKRDFLYAGDAVAMAVELLEKGEFGQVYNMGSENTTNIFNLANVIAEMCKIPVRVFMNHEDKVRPWEIWYLQSDNSKLYRAITRRPQVTLQEALERTITSYNFQGGKWAWQLTE